MHCPLCGKEAKTSSGLLKHLTGGIPYGGHERSPGDAAVLVKGPELPLKKRDSLQTTNVDYLLFRTTPDGRETWVFFELKTDEGSINDVQLESYRSAPQRGMPSLLEDLALVRGRSNATAKYDELQRRLQAFPADRPIELVYLAPVAVDAGRLGPEGRSVTFAELRRIELPRHAEVWRAFRDSVLARAF